MLGRFKAKPPAAVASRALSQPPLQQRYHTALGSSGEVLACYDTAEAMNYIDPVGSEARDRVDHVIGTLVNVLRLRR